MTEGNAPLPGPPPSLPPSAGDGTPWGSPPPAPGAPQKHCHACGELIDARAEICPRCGVRQPWQPGMAGNAVTRTGKSKLVAALLAIFLGGLGIHKFYLGDMGMGVLYLVFFWTAIPAIIGLIEGILWLVQSDEEWLRKYGDR